MKKFVSIAIATAALMISGAVSAAQFMTVLTVQTDDVAGYASFVGELNKTWAAEGIDASGSVYVPAQAGEAVGVAYFVAFIDSAQRLAMGNSLNTNKAVMDLIASADVVRTRVDNGLWIALIDGGVYDNGAVYSTIVTTTDTAAYMAAVGELGALLAANGLGDAKVSVFAAVAAGEAAGSLQVILAVENQERMAAVLDAMGSDWMQAFLAKAAPIRTLVSNGIFMTVPTE